MTGYFRTAKRCRTAPAITANQDTANDDDNVNKLHYHWRTAAMYEYFGTKRLGRTSATKVCGKNCYHLQHGVNISGAAKRSTAPKRLWGRKSKSSGTVCGYTLFMYECIQDQVKGSFSVPGRSLHHMCTSVYSISYKVVLIR